ncbi:hypothetical protein C5167_048126 [Papaver somniferum]|uniref:Uncharacterized protein n=1 Tax=Papaver somniferum TaxID=3469 RepID=A0A4Y7KL18_PAPSO|nr:hypothetical protein C5167_048126 [Papaver somniferum]
MVLFSRRGASGFSACNTAEDVTLGIDGSGLTAIITGSSNGIGAETARVLAMRGVPIVMAVRNTAAGTFHSINEKVCGRIKSSGLPLNILINNAGVMALPYKLSPDKVELQFATNHLGHFLLTDLLLETMKKTASQSNIEGRIVNVSSEAHKYNSWGAYGQSKLANILHANELSRRLKEDGAAITVNSLHPGAIVTNLWRDSSIFGGKSSSMVSF